MAMMCMRWSRQLFFGVKIDWGPVCRVSKNRTNFLVHVLIYAVSNLIRLELPSTEANFNNGLHLSLSILPLDILLVYTGTRRHCYSGAVSVIRPRAVVRNRPRCYIVTFTMRRRLEIPTTQNVKNVSLDLGVNGRWQFRLFNYCYWLWRARQILERHLFRPLRKGLVATSRLYHIECQIGPSEAQKPSFLLRVFRF